MALMPTSSAQKYDSDRACDSRYDSTVRNCVFGNKYSDERQPCHQRLEYVYARPVDELGV
jgi:hypothetical protein